LRLHRRSAKNAEGSCRHYKLFAGGIIINRAAFNRPIIANPLLTVKLRSLGEGRSGWDQKYFPYLDRQALKTWQVFDHYH